MRFDELINEQDLTEGGKSGGARYNSEIGLLFAFTGVGTFDIDNIEGSFDWSQYSNPEKVRSEVMKFLPSNYNEKLWNAWVKKGHEIKSQIIKHSGSFPTQLEWVGGDNSGGVADIGFMDHPSSGISVKDSGGITLANLTPKALGIEPAKGSDVFAHYAQDEFDVMKKQIFTDLLNDAKSNPDVRITPLSDKYAITYISAEDVYVCEGKKTIKASAQEILGQISRNSPWQRVFGDYFQSHFQAKKGYAAPLYQKIAKIFEQIIEAKLSTVDELANVLRIEEKPYYYVTPKKAYFVPGRSDIDDLRVKSIRYGNPDGTSQLFYANIGMKDSDDAATIDVYIRYANGMFEANPTVRVQNLRNPQFILWNELD